MTYQTVPVPLVGGSNPVRDRATSQERTLGLYPEATGSGAYPSVLLPWPGSIPLSGLLNLGTPRGFYATSTGELYKVVNTTLYQVDFDGSETSIGEILGQGPVIMADDGFNLLMATESFGYIYDGTTLRQNLSENYEPGGSVAFLNSRAIWQGNDQRWAVSDPGAPDTINALNYATAESSGDKLLRVYVFRELAYFFGSKTIEPWYDAGSNDNPPFERINNGKMDVGLISKLAVSSNDNYLYWLGDDKNLYRTSAYSPQPLMPPSIHFEVSKYGLVNANVLCLTHSGQFFVLVLTDDISLVYSETTNAWFELGYKTQIERYLAYSYAYVFDKHMIINREDGRVLELSFDEYQDNELTTIRERITVPFTSGNGSRMVMKRAELIMQTGVGNLTEPNPLIKISHSCDFGQSWSNEQFIQAGRDSDNAIRVEYYAMCSFRQIQFRIRTSDPNFFSFQSLTIDVRAGGDY